MNKRPHSEIDSRSDDVSKRQKSDPGNDISFSSALQSLAENSSDLIDCLKSLRKWHKHRSDGGEPFAESEQLKALSRKLSPSFHSLASDPGSSRHEEKKAPAPAECAPILSCTLAPWTSAEIPKELPPLPKVRNSDLERQAFTHPGCGRNHYERLEWLGDAYLETIATVIIDATFPSMASGRCSQLREQLIRNVTLAQFFRDYKMDEKAILPPEFSKDAATRPGRGRSSDKDLIKTQGDMFEAYVAAIIVGDSENGLTDCANWLRALWSRSLREQIVRGEKDGQTASTKKAGEAGRGETAEGKQLKPKEQLAKEIVVKGIDLKYKDMPTKEKKDKHIGMPLFTVGVYLTGWGEDDKLLGWGSALNKREAGEKAATRAMENKKQMKIYRQKKESFMKAALAARGEAENGSTAEA